MARLAQYDLFRQVGSGAMGVVHEGHDIDLDRPVAIKLLNANAARDPKLIERFLREARSAAQLIHPNVALIYQVGRHEDLTFIAMEWLDGGDLSQAVKEHGALPWREAAAALRDAAAGLAAAQAVGLVHRDIKPSNLMRNRSGQVKLVDFGLARLHDAPSDLTQTGNILGTPAYLSPEQCMGDVATPLSDIYALACTGFQLLTGRPPFNGPHMAAVLNGHLHEPMPDAHALVPDVPEALAHVLQRAGAKRPSERYATASALQADLQAVLEGRATFAARNIEMTAALDYQQTQAQTQAQVPPLNASPASAPATAAAAQASIDILMPEEPPVQGNLSLDANAFIGRDQETAQLTELLHRARLVTLTGPGGTGKTRLSLHVARQLASGFADGAWLVELAPLAADAGDSAAAAESVLSAVCALFDLRDEAGVSSEEQLLKHLQPRQLMLVLDNCEHLLDAAARLAQRILQRCARVRLLATSRQALGVPGELTLGVPPLATGEDDATPQELERVEAVRLFVERAAAARPGFRLTPENAAAVAQICRRLDGIPLAIELASARVKVLTPMQIAARLDDAFKLLTGGQRTLLPRQQTLRALIDWSWDLLDEAERQLFARISVFAGDFSLEAAEGVLPDLDSEADQVLDGLAGLVDKSLLVAVERSGRMRYRTLETIRQYGAEKLAAAGQTLVLQRRHARFFAREAQAAVERLNGDEHADAALWLQLEHDNARAALDAVTAQRWFDIGTPLATSLAHYWFWRGTLGEGVARIERLMAQNPPASPSLAEMLRPAGVMAVYLGRQELARQWFEHGLAVARETHQPAHEANLLGGLGSLLVARGEMLAAKPLFERSLQLYAQLQDTTGLAKAQHNLGTVCANLGDNAVARHHLTEALTLHRASSNQNYVANGLMSLGELEYADGNTDQAQALYQSSLDMLSSMGDDWSAAYARYGLGRCALDAGNLGSARNQFQLALQVVRRLGDKASIADQLDSLATVALLEGQREQASQLAEESLTLRLGLNNPALLAASLETYAALHADQQPEHSARLLGAVSKLLDSATSSVPPARQARQRALCQSLQQRLGTAAFEQLWAEGADQDPAELARGP